MKLVKAYVENFGRLHQTTFEFCDGINVINKENGWGKTTLSVYLKSMFFGMDKGGTLKSKELKERNRYLPWQGGIYGGYLVFESQGKSYRIERSFGEKEKDDKFQLYYDATNLLCDEYSDNIGEELFGLDRASFERSICIAPDRESEGGMMTDKINAKLNNLIESKDDIGNFENAHKRLADYHKETVKSIAKENDRIAKLQLMLAECESKEGAMLSKEEQIKERQQVLNEKQVRRDEIGVLMAQAVQYSHKKQYLRVCENERMAREKLERATNSFVGQPPKKEGRVRAAELLLAIKSLQEGNEDVQQVDVLRNRLQSKEKEFVKGLPTEEQIGNYRELNREIQNYRLQSKKGRENKEYLSLCQKFGKNLLSDEEIESNKNLAREYRQLEGKLQELRLKVKENEELQRIRTEEQQRAELKQKKNMVLIFFFCAGLALIAGIVLLFIQKIAAAVAFTIGIVLMIFGIITATRKMKKLTQQPESTLNEESIASVEECYRQKQQIQERLIAFLEKFEIHGDERNFETDISLLENDYRHFKAYQQEESEAEELRNENSRCAEERSHKIEAFLAQYELTTEEERFDAALTTLEKDIREYTSLMSRVQNAQNVANTIQKNTDEVEDFLQNYGEKSDTEQKERLQRLEERCERLSDATKEWESVRNAREQFERDNDVSKFASVEEPKSSLEELQSELELLNGEVDVISNTIANYQRDLDAFYSVVEEKPEIEQELDSLGIQIDELSKKAEGLDQTMLFLQKARDNLSLRYLSGMKEVFYRFVSTISNQSDVENEYQMDLNLNILIASSGRTWRKEYLSAGYQDLLNVCMKLALAEAMFQKEAPFLILDDPFVNLDPGKIEQAKMLLQKIGESHQIIYFICHDCRG